MQAFGLICRNPTCSRVLCDMCPEVPIRLLERCLCWVPSRRVSASPEALFLTDSWIISAAFIWFGHGGQRTVTGGRRLAASSPHAPHLNTRPVNETYLFKHPFGIVSYQILMCSNRYSKQNFVDSRHQHTEATLLRGIIKIQGRGIQEFLMDDQGNFIYTRVLPQSAMVAIQTVCTVYHLDVSCLCMRHRIF